MTILKQIVLALLLVVSITALLASGDNHSVAYTKLGIDARLTGMGGAGAGFLDNVSATFLNPATLADVKRHEIAFSYRANMEYDRNFLSAAAGFELPLGYIALSWLHAGTNDLIGTGMSGEPTGNFDDYENNINLSYALKIGHFNFGLTPKLYLSKIDADSKNGYGIDLGALWHVNRYFNAGFVARELVSEFDGKKNTRDLIPGIAAFPVPGLVIAADLVGENDFDTTKLRFGAEYWIGAGEDDNRGSSTTGVRVRESSTWSNVFAKTQAGIRAGLNDGQFGCGFGLRFSMFEVNYAYQLTDKDSTLDTKDHHLVSLSLRF